MITVTSYCSDIILITCNLLPNPAYWALKHWTKKHIWSVSDYAVHSIIKQTRSECIFHTHMCQVIGISSSEMKENQLMVENDMKQNKWQPNTFPDFTNYLHFDSSGKYGKNFIYCSISCCQENRLDPLNHLTNFLISNIVKCKCYSDAYHIVMCYSCIMSCLSVCIKVMVSVLQPNLVCYHLCKFLSAMSLNCWLLSYYMSRASRCYIRSLRREMREMKAASTPRNRIVHLFHKARVNTCTSHHTLTFIYTQIYTDSKHSVSFS